MNEHLAPVFEVLLPALDEGGIDYWVFGGVSVAACTGGFVRENKDVDIFVRSDDFPEANSLLGDLCSQRQFEFVEVSRRGDRPKTDVKIDQKERLSMIPVYVEGDDVRFRYADGDQIYPVQILARVRRTIPPYSFFSPGDKFIKHMFVEHIKARPDKLRRTTFQTDMEAICPNTGLGTACRDECVRHEMDEYIISTGVTILSPPCPFDSTPKIKR